MQNAKMQKCKKWAAIVMIRLLSLSARIVDVIQKYIEMQQQEHKIPADYIANWGKRCNFAP